MNVARWMTVPLVLVAACGGDSIDGDHSTPILELPRRSERSCNLISPATLVGDGLASNFDLVALGGRHHALTTRNDPGQSVALSPLQLEPIALGAPVWSTSADASYEAAAAPREGGGVVLAWAEDIADQSGYRLAVATLDESGTQLGATRFVATDSGFGLLTLVIRPGGGFALAWSGAGGSAVRLVMLDADGAPLGTEPQTIAMGPQIGGHLMRHGDGFALVWSQRSGDSASFHAVLLADDANGTRLTEPVEIPTRSDRSNYGLVAASVGTDVLVAWEENYYPGDFGDEGGHAIVRLARVSGGGELAGPVLRLQAPESGFVNVNPTFAHVGDRLVLSWSRGDYIAVCAGCISDNRMHFVELDPVDLVPVSNIVDVEGPAGLKSAPVATLDGRDFAYLLAVDRHARFDLAAAMVRCDAAP